MSVGTADLYTAIVAAWNNSGLATTFKSLWDDPTSTDFGTLYDQEAAPGQLAPYCVLDQFTSKTTARMSGTTTYNREIRDIQVKFNIHAGEVAGDSRSAKRIAADLAEDVMEQFGGHPTVAAQSQLAITNGKVLLTQYQTDYGVLEDDGRYLWVVLYIIRVDVPKAV